MAAFSPHTTPGNSASILCIYSSIQIINYLFSIMLAMYCLNYINKVSYTYCVHACVRACVRACMHACVHACVPAYIHSTYTHIIIAIP